MKKLRMPRAISWSLSVAFWIGVWALLALRVGNDFLLPDPGRTLEALWQLMQEKEFWISAAVSLLRILRGILWGASLGILLGVMMHASGTLRALFSPLLAVIKSTPIASVIILLLLWMKRDDLPVLITVLIVLPTVSANISQGLGSTDRDLKAVAKLYGFSLTKKLTKLYLPTVMPYFFAACRSALGMAWKAGIAAEVL